MKLSLAHKTLLAIAFSSLWLSSIAKAQTITTDQAFSFGTFAISDFSSVLSITIANNGSSSTTGPVVLFINPTRGEYTVDAGIANRNTNFTVTTPSSITLTGPVSSFTVDNFVVRPPNPRFNNSGIENLVVVGRLRSQGDGMAIGNASYTGNLDLTLNY